jgi:hypothetical protein
MIHIDWPIRKRTMDIDKTTRTLTEIQMHAHVEQRIQERMNLSHLYRIEQGEDGPQAVCTGCAAASIWRVVLDAVREAQWRITK